MQFLALKANTMAFSKTFVFRELTADKLVVHKPHDNICIFVRKKQTRYVLRSISAETFIFLSGEGVP